MKWTLAAVLALSTACVGAESSSLSSEQGARVLAESAMKLVAADKVKEAFDLLKPHWPLPGNEIDTLVLQTIQQRDAATPRFGAIVGYVFVREERVGDFALRYTYVEKRESHMIRWVFTFYRPRDRWIINSVIWDDNFGKLFGE